MNILERNNVHVEGDSGPVLLYAHGFGRLLNNYLSNAAKFSPQGGQVEIAVRRVNGVVRVEVIDHGDGIPKQFKAHIFKKFSQTDSSDSRQKGGAGLGLAISKELIEHMHGAVGFDSVAGQGACFILNCRCEATIWQRDTRAKIRPGVQINTEYFRL